MWTTRGWHTLTGNVWCAKRYDSKRAAAVAAALEFAAFAGRIRRLVTGSYDGYVGQIRRVCRADTTGMSGRYDGYDGQILL